MYDCSLNTFICVYLEDYYVFKGLKVCMYVCMYVCMLCVAVVSTGELSRGRREKERIPQCIAEASKGRHSGIECSTEIIR